MILDNVTGLSHLCSYHKGPFAGECAEYLVSSCHCHLEKAVNVDHLDKSMKTIFFKQLVFQLVLSLSSISKDINRTARPYYDVLKKRDEKFILISKISISSTFRWAGMTHQEQLSFCRFLPKLSRISSFNAARNLGFFCNHPFVIYHNQLQPGWRGLPPYPQFG